MNNPYSFNNNNITNQEDITFISVPEIDPKQLIADDIKNAAMGSIVFSLLIIFLYILLRFRKWQFSLGAVVAVFHDVLIVLSIFLKL